MCTSPTGAEAYLDKQGIVSPILRQGPLPGCRVLPVEVQAVELVVADVREGGLDELCKYK